MKAVVGYAAPMRTLTVCGGRLVIVCPCGYLANGHQPESVLAAVKAHESFTHGKGLTAETHALLRMAARV